MHTRQPSSSQPAHRFGWKCDQSARTFNRGRGPLSSPGLADGVIRPNWACPDAHWGVELLNGAYDVTVFYCDAMLPSDTRGCLIEGLNASAGVVPVCSSLETGGQWTNTVQVTDGQLTLSSDGSCSGLNAIKITQAITPLPGGNCRDDYMSFLGPNKFSHNCTTEWFICNGAMVECKWDASEPTRICTCPGIRRMRTRGKKLL